MSRHRVVSAPTPRSTSGNTLYTHIYPPEKTIFNQRLACIFTARRYKSACCTTTNKWRYTFLIYPHHKTANIGKYVVFIFHCEYVFARFYLKPDTFEHDQSHDCNSKCLSVQ